MAFPDETLLIELLPLAQKRESWRRWLGDEGKLSFPATATACHGEDRPRPSAARRRPYLGGDTAKRRLAFPGSARGRRVSGRHESPGTNSSVHSVLEPKGCLRGRWRYRRPLSRLVPITASYSGAVLTQEKRRVNRIIRTASRHAAPGPDRRSFTHRTRIGAFQCLLHS